MEEDACAPRRPSPGRSRLPSGRLRRRERARTASRASLLEPESAPVVYCEVDGVHGSSSLATAVVALAGCGGSKDAAADDGSAPGATTAPDPTAPARRRRPAARRVERAGREPRSTGSTGGRSSRSTAAAVEVPFFTSTADALAGRRPPRGRRERGRQRRSSSTSSACGRSGPSTSRGLPTSSGSTGRSPTSCSRPSAAIPPWSRRSTRRRTRSSRPTTSTAPTLYSQAAARRLVSLVAPTDRIGPARLVVFDGSELREVTLADVPAGLGAGRRAPTTATTGRASRCPALAVDPEGKRALVVPAGEPRRRGRPRHDGGPLPRPVRARLAAGGACATGSSRPRRRRRSTAPTATPSGSPPASSP